MISIAAAEELIADRVRKLGVDCRAGLQGETLGPPQRQAFQGVATSAQKRASRFLVEVFIKPSHEGYAFIDQIRSALTGLIPEGATTALYQESGRWAVDRNVYEMVFTLNNVVILDKSS